MQKITQKIIAKTIGAYINLLSCVAPSKSYALAYNLFSQPRKGKFNTKTVPKTLQKAAHEILFYKEQQIHVYKWLGNDECILLVHGWESNAARWKKTIPFLTKTGKTIIAIDGPGHGLNTDKEFNVPNYADFIDVVTKKYNPKIVIGHSLGGNTLAYFQANYNHNFEKIVLLGAPSDFEVILNNYIKMLGLNERIFTFLKENTKNRFKLTIEEFSASRFLQNTTIPGLIVHDVDDKVVQFDEAKKIAVSWKTAQFIETKGLGHSMHDDDLYSKVVAFIEK